MKLNNIVLVILCGILGTAWVLTGCGQSNPPVEPASDSILTINVPAVNVKKAHSQVFVGDAQNTILYCISGSGKPVTGSFGPLPAAAVTNSMGFSVTLQGAASSYKLVALQINDASTGLPLAFGAAPFTSSGITIELGPMESSCYSVTALSYNSLFSFENPYGTGTDILCNYTPDAFSGYELDNPTQPPSIASIAYMGNGNLVDFASVPPSSRFQVSSSLSKGFDLGNLLAASPVSIGVPLGSSASPDDYPLATGDVYCVQMAGGGYAWLQITNPGSIPNGTGPSFVFRLNTTVPYCAYEQSQGDLSGICSPAG